MRDERLTNSKKRGYESKGYVTAADEREDGKLGVLREERETMRAEVRDTGKEAEKGKLAGEKGGERKVWHHTGVLQVFLREGVGGYLEECGGGAGDDAAQSVFLGEQPVFRDG